MVDRKNALACLESAEGWIRAGMVDHLLLVLPTIDRTILALQKEADTPSDEQLQSILLELSFRRLREQCRILRSRQTNDN
jgi:hypothetical protein